jgi:DUF2075 family protein
MEKAAHGWESLLPDFTVADRKLVLDKLLALVPDAGEGQRRAWRDAIPLLQQEGRELLAAEGAGPLYGTILEYVMPMEARRPDFLVLADGAVVVVELKGKAQASRADIDQVAAYARDLRCYHRDCADQPVQPLLVPTRMQGRYLDPSGVIVCGPDALDAEIRDLPRRRLPPTPVDRFLDESAYRPLPTLVAAARELLRSGSVRRVTRAAAATEPTVGLLRDIAHEAARTRTRRLVLVTGVPGAGKTLVGLQTVHAHWLDDLVVARADGAPTAPGVFLSGNGPLVEVLQYELTREKADGKTFVRGVKDYVKRYSSKRNPVPPEHVLVFDEAQRAWDRAQVAAKHADLHVHAKSEPELFVEFAERIPEWCVVVGLIGGGQEIHKGEEGGLAQWRDAIARSPRAHEWTVHAPRHVEPLLRLAERTVAVDERLNLTTELRFHLTKDVHAFVADLLGGRPADDLQPRAAALEAAGYHLRITRDLEQAKHYLWERYASEPEKRFGLLASSRDKRLEDDFGVPNSFQATKNVKVGPWYADPQEHAAGHSCRRLVACVTEFGAQGLELDAALVAWGSDFVRAADADGHTTWSIGDARKYKKDAVPVRNPAQLRLNSYRVLLTRGREATVLFVPPRPHWDATWDYLRAAGLRELT